MSEREQIQRLERLVLRLLGMAFPNPNTEELRYLRKDILAYFDLKVKPPAVKPPKRCAGCNNAPCPYGGECDK